MGSAVRLLLTFTLPFVLGKLVEVVLGSAPGQKLAVKSGWGELTTPDGINMASKYATTAVGALALIYTTMSARQEYKGVPAIGGAPVVSNAAIAVDAGEILLAVGGVVKVVGDFLQDRNTLKAKRAKF